MTQSAAPRHRLRGTQGTLGTFAGVFTPSILTILGIILFLRLGYVVGSAGLKRALVIIALANTISVLTTISLSAVATNLKVKGGGDYYLISRTLGVEFGGAIGVVLFLAQSISIAFYCIGFGEAAGSMLAAGSGYMPQLIAAGAVAFLCVFAWLGADWATRLQYVIMAVMGAALLSFYIGGVSRFDGAVLAANWSGTAGGPPFWIIFAIFFPAVTGFTQGVSMSGDLKDPGRSLPRGTFLAVGLSIVVYFTVAVIFAGAMPVESLRGDYAAMQRVASIGIIVSMGVVAATLSSAMASFLGAPRILQSVAQDRIFPFLQFFARGEGEANNPRRGVILSGCIALATVSLGKLNVIAPIVSMFFLISYGLLNYATFYEARAQSPSFRPTFRWFDYRASLLGALGCLGVMVAIDILSSAIAVAVLFGIYEYLKRTTGPVRWADSRHSYHFQLMRDHLLAIPGEVDHPRDWRPQILAFSDQAARRVRLLQFASWIEGGSGLTTAVRVLEGTGKKMYRLRDEAEAEIKADIAAHGLDTFVRVLAVPDLRAGVRTLIQSFGIGPVRPNTILINGPEQLEGIKGQRRYGRYLNEAVRLGCNIVILNSDEDAWHALEQAETASRRIDIWWQDDMTGRLMLLLAYLMTRTEAWEEAELRVLLAGARKNAAIRREQFRRVLEDLRIDAEPYPVESAKIDSIAEHSQDAAMVFVPLTISARGPVGPHGVYLETILSRLPIAAMVIAAEDIDLGAEPEEGTPGDIATALDKASDAERLAKESEKEAARLVQIVEKKRTESARDAQSPEEKKKLTEELRTAEERMKKTQKKAAQARNTAVEATLRAEKLAGAPVDKNDAHTDDDDTDPGNEVPDT